MTTKQSKITDEKNKAGYVIRRDLSIIDAWTNKHDRTVKIGPTCNQCPMAVKQDDEDTYRCKLIDRSFLMKLGGLHSCWFIRRNLNPLEVKNWDEDVGWCNCELCR